MSKVDYVSLFIKFYVKEFKARCFYELNDYLLFENEHKSLYHFLKNNKILNPKIISRLKYMFDKIARLFKLREKFNLYDFEILKDEISNSATDKHSWISEKIDELNS
jgi:hypothetical protein